MNLTNVLVDFVAIGLLAGMFFHRHHRREVFVALFAVNVAVFAATATLLGGAISMGLGLGLFGVLSIIRLRSSLLSHAEVAYYFVALAMGLLGGMSFEPLWLGRGMVFTLVALMAVVDSPLLLRGYRIQDVTVEGAYTDERKLQADMAEILNARVLEVTITKLDVVGKKTTATVKYQVDRSLEVVEPLRKPVPEPVPVVAEAPVAEGVPVAPDGAFVADAAAGDPSAAAYAPYLPLVEGVPASAAYPAAPVMAPDAGATPYPAVPVVAPHAGATAYPAFPVAPVNGTPDAGPDASDPPAASGVSPRRLL